MKTLEERWPDISTECQWTTQRSSGPGGQNVNKTETRVTLKWNIRDSIYLDELERQRLLLTLHKKLTDEGTTIQISSEKHRTQHQNKKDAQTKLWELIQEALHVEKPRKATRPPKQAIQDRLEKKSNISERKAYRGNLKNKSFNIDE